MHSFKVEYIGNHLFVNGYFGRLSHNYFRCYDPRCPFSVLMDVEMVSNKSVAVSCRSVVVSAHCHGEPGKTAAEIRNTLLRQLKYIHEHPNDEMAVRLLNQHLVWNEIARQYSKEVKVRLIDIETLKIYNFEHPGMSAKEILDRCGVAMNPRSLCNIIVREKLKRGISVDIKNMIEKKTHHVLGNDGQDIIVFGLKSSLKFLATTPLIQGDGTFTCVVLPYTQLYVFHALLKNGVSYPVLYCLVRGKTQAMYTRLLDLVENIAKEQDLTIFDRPVRLMVDFEKSFHNAVQKYQAGRRLSCCFFHFVSNIKKATTPINCLKKTMGKGLLMFLKRKS